MIIDLAEWFWDHWQEVTFNAFLLFILRRFIIKELSQLLRPSQTEAMLSNQRVMMRVAGVENEWKSNLPMNGFKIMLPQISKKLCSSSRKDMKHLKIRRKTKMNNQNINYATLIPTILGAAKLILQTFGIDIPDTTINEIVNGAAAVGTIIGIFMAHRKQTPQTVAQTADPNKFIQG